MYKPTLVTGPAAPVVTRQEAKRHLRLDGDEEDELVDGLIAAAMGLLDGWSGTLGRCLINQTWRITADRFCQVMRLPLPATSIASVKGRDSAGALSAAIDAANYDLQHDARGSFVRFRDAYAYPGDLAETEGVVIEFVAGYGAAATAVPGSIRLAMLLLIGHWYANREAVGNITTELPLAVASLLAPHRLRSL
jgi:uncharacterized phiE125 gp8 family phage protein